MLSILSKIASKWKFYALIALGVVAGFLRLRVAGLKQDRAERAQQDAEAQRDVLTKAQANIESARKEGRKREDEASKDADSGDWSGFNDGV